MDTKIWNISEHIIYLTKHGSQAYGLAIEDSDLDLKGVCIPPYEVTNHLFQGFEQAENNQEVNEKYKYLVNPKNPKLESVVYSLYKFMKLASACNPNIIEVLWCDDEDILTMTNEGDELRFNRDMFISSRCKHTFAGYSWNQLAKINRHRKWLVNPTTEPPKRSDFGLSEKPTERFSEVERLITRQVESWNLANISLSDMERSELKETMWEFLATLSGMEITWDNWQKVYSIGAIHKLGTIEGMPKEIIELANREYAYKLAKKDYEGYLNWETTRNPVRKALEEKHKYDVKHAMHLVRLLKMGVEILETGKVIVKRPDREELLAIKNGDWAYDQLITYAEEMQTKLNEAYKTTKLPREVNYERINAAYCGLIQWRYEL